MIIDVVIPVLNEEESIGLVLAELPHDKIRNIIVCDNGSTDRTVEIALANGATVVHQTIKGYGAACLKAMDYISDQIQSPDIVLYIDGDYSDYPSEAINILEPLIIENYDLVIGSRVLGKSEKGSLTKVQNFGNWLSTKLIHLLYNYKFTDLGPFRAIRYQAYKKLNMKDQNFGWTVEMQVKAAKYKLLCKELPVSYKKRLGKSKVSGTIVGSIMAGYKILYTIFKLL
ncbi:MAG: glycosyltransferase family 2 protein [Saprospiraceae bacterium]